SGTPHPWPSIPPWPSGTPWPWPSITPWPSGTPHPWPSISPWPSGTPWPWPSITPWPTHTPHATPIATPTPVAAVAVQPLNISTRLHVEAGENVAIGGFMITGSSPKTVAIRGMGPSLQSAGFFGTALSDPSLQLRGSDNSLIASNDNWRDNPLWAAALETIGLAPGFDLESAI